MIRILIFTTNWKSFILILFRRGSEDGQGQSHRVEAFRRMYRCNVQIFSSHIQNVIFSFSDLFFVTETRNQIMWTTTHKPSWEVLASLLCNHLTSIVITNVIWPPDDGWWKQKLSSTVSWWPRWSSTWRRWMVDGAKQWLALVLTPSMDPPFTLFGTCFVQIHRQKPSPETFTTSPCRVNCKLQCILLQAF